MRRTSQRRQSVLPTPGTEKTRKERGENKGIKEGRRGK